LSVAARRAIAALVGLAGLLAATGVRADARALFDRALRTTRDARASFTQSVSGPLGAVDSRGTFEYLRPRRVCMRWTGKAAATAYVVQDTFWFDQPGQGAIVRGNARSIGAPAGLFVDRSLADLERACAVRARGPLALELTPRDPSAGWSLMSLNLDRATGWPRTATLHTKDGGVTKLAFGPFRLNQGLAPARFRPVFARGRIVTGWNP
jgi:outer membrane lipoprotein-sorting protein